MVASIDRLQGGKLGLNYGDFCMAHDIYTLELYDSRKDGWNNPAGYYLTVDVGDDDLRAGPDAAPAWPPSPPCSPPTCPSRSTTPTGSSTTRRRARGRQLERRDLRRLRLELREGGGHGQPHGDDGVHPPRGADSVAGGLPRAERAREVRGRRGGLLQRQPGGALQPGGGVRRLRRRLIDRSRRLRSSPSSTWCCPLVGAVAGKNVMAFEVHRAPGQSEIVFDATGVFGVNDCSVGVDTFAAIDASTRVERQEGGLVGFEPHGVRIPDQHRRRLPGVDGGEPGGLQVQQLRACRPATPRRATASR